MLMRMNELFKFNLHAKEDDIGHANDFLFDDNLWVVRYIVLTPHKWIPFGKKRLVSPIACDVAQVHQQVIPINLPREKIETGPLLENNRPLSRQYEIEFFRHFGYAFYWNGPGLWGTYPHPAALVDQAELDEAQEHKAENDASYKSDQERNSNLQSIHEVENYRLQAGDMTMGRIEDFILNLQSWAIESIIMNTHTWLPGGKQFVLPIQYVEDIKWQDRAVTTSLSPREFKERIAPLKEMGELLKRA